MMASCDSSCYASRSKRRRERLRRTAVLKSKQMSQHLYDILSCGAVHADAAESLVLNSLAHEFYPAYPDECNDQVEDLLSSLSYDAARIGAECHVPIRRQQHDEQKADVLPLPPSEPARQPESEDWQFLQESLRPCLSALRNQFDKDVYDMCMKQHEALDDAVAARTQAISSIVDDLVVALSAAMRSERARNLIKEYEFRIRRLLKQEVNEMFALIEEVPGSWHTAERLDRVYAEPKIPPNAYFLYLSRMRAQCEAESGSAHLPAGWMQAGWKQMNAKDRKEYEMEASKLKGAYEEQLTDYRELGHYKVLARPKHKKT